MMPINFSDNSKEASSPISLNKTITMDGDLASIVSCPVCLNIFEKPKLLTDCAHSLCLNCAKMLRKSDKITCPQCRVDSLIGAELHVKNVLKTNFLVQAMVDVINSENNTQPAVVGLFCPHFPAFTKSVTTCGHCSQRFCEVCMLCHMERLRLEIRWISGQFENRIKKASEDLESRKEMAMQMVREKVAEAKQEIADAGKRGGGSFTDQQVVDALGSEALSEVNRIINDATSTPQLMAALDRRIFEVTNRSPLLLSPQKIIQLHRDIIKRDREIFLLEQLETSVVGWKISVGNFQGNDLMAISVSRGDPIKWNKQDSSLSWRLRLACQANDVESLTSILRPQQHDGDESYQAFVVEHRSPNAEDCGRTLLHLASISGSLEVVKYLLTDHSADHLARDNNGCTALHMAAKGGHLEVVKLLADWDSQLIDAKSNSGNTPLNLAAAFGRLQVVRYLVLEKSADVENRNSKLGLTPVMQAAKNGHLDTLKFLIEETKSDIINKATDPQRRNVLHLAVCLDQTLVVRFLVERLPDLLKSADCDGDTPLDYAIVKNNVSTIACIIDTCPESITYRGAISLLPLHRAAASGKLDAVKYLISKGADVCERIAENYGFMPIHFAVYFGRVQVVEYLLYYKIDLILTESTNGLTCLNIAKKMKRQDVADLLQKIANFYT